MLHVTSTAELQNQRHQVVNDDSWEKERCISKVHGCIFQWSDFTRRRWRVIVNYAIDRVKDMVYEAEYGVVEYQPLQSSSVGTMVTQQLT